MKKISCVFILMVMLLCTACSSAIDTDKLLGTWSCTTGEDITVTITKDTFTQASGDTVGEPLKYERNSDGLNIRNTDGKLLLRLYYSEENNSIYYDAYSEDGSEIRYTFSKAE